MKINTVLTIASCVGSVSIAVCAARDTKKAQVKISRLDLSPKENVKHVWKDYIPTGIAVAGTLGCILASHKVNAKQVAALGATVAGLKAAYYKYGDKVKEFVGSEKATKIREAFEKERAEDLLKTVDVSKIKPRSKAKKSKLAYFYDPITDQFVYTTKEAIEAGVAWASKKLKEENFFDVNEYMTEIGGYLVDYGDYSYIVASGNWSCESHEDEKQFEGWIGIDDIAIDSFEPVDGEIAGLATDEPIYVIRYDMISKTPNELDPHFEEILDPDPKEADKEDK